MTKRGSDTQHTEADKRSDQELRSDRYDKTVGLSQKILADRPLRVQIIFVWSVV